jgi:glycosyltransferase involved in cell wall biosynthesis
VKILYIEPLGVRGGMGHYNEALIVAYDRAGADVDLVTGSHDPTHEFRADVHVSRFFRAAMDRSKPRVVRGAGYVGGYLGCLLLAWRADVVVMHFLHRPAVDLLAIKAFRRFGTVLVLVAHEPRPILDSQRGDAFQRSLRAFDIVVVHGPKARDDIVAWGVAEDRVLVASHGEFRPIPPLAAVEASGALGTSDLARPVAAIVGNLRIGKGVRRAREALQGSDSPVRTLLVAGTRHGLWDLDDALLTPKGSPLTIVRVDRRMSDLEEWAAYSLADVVLALYDSGYSSGVISRAHSMGKPVVLTDVGDLARQAGPCDVVLPSDYTAGQLRSAVDRCLQAVTEAPTEWDRGAWLFHAESVLARRRGT